MAERGEGVAAPDQRQRKKSIKSTTEPATTTTIATTKSRPSRTTTTAFTFKLVKFLTQNSQENLMRMQRCIYFI